MYRFAVPVVLVLLGLLAALGCSEDPSFVAREDNGQVDLVTEGDESADALEDRGGTPAEDPKEGNSEGDASQDAEQPDGEDEPEDPGDEMGTVALTGALTPRLDCLGDIEVGHLFECQVRLGALEVDPVFSLGPGAPPGMSIDPVTGKITWEPTSEELGQHFIPVSATAEGVTGTSDLTLDVLSLDLNPEFDDPPVLIALPDRSVDLQELVSFRVSASDPEGAPLTFTVSGLPEGATFDQETRTFSWIPQTGQSGTYDSITLSVSDGENVVDQTFSIEVRPIQLEVQETETIPPHPVIALDVLFVIDTSGSMNYVATGVAEFLGSFLATLDDNNTVDYQLAMLLAHSKAPWAGRLFHNGTTASVLRKQDFATTNLLRAAFSDNFTHFIGGDPDGGEASLYSLNKAVTDVLEARDKGTEATVSELDAFFREGAALAIVFLADENDVCYRSEYSEDFPLGKDTDVGGGERLGYLEVCFPDGLLEAEKTENRRSITAGTVYDNLQRLKGRQPVSITGIIFNDLGDPTLYDQQLLALEKPKLNVENETGRGYKEMIKTCLGAPGIADDDPAYMAQVVDLIDINLNRVDFDDSLSKLGEAVVTTDITLTLGQRPIKESLVIRLIAVDGETLAAPVLLRVRKIIGRYVSVIVPENYYLSQIELAISYEVELE
ncbi:MAG: hypothetical protein A2284_15905 [Deltaproteobacteria bacterium RIFOXYA12_FULL_61_11]|nr:MAG: hypothetical protein A2284_15905 [Deltaproteobacteria bacterium RIFOXYA12_FULL_61_11]